MVTKTLLSYLYRKYTKQTYFYLTVLDVIPFTLETFTCFLEFEEVFLNNTGYLLFTEYFDII